MGLRVGPDWCGKFRPTEIRSPDRPARRQSLYRLRYPAPYIHMYVCMCIYIYIYTHTHTHTHTHTTMYLRKPPLFRISNPIFPL